MDDTTYHWDKFTARINIAVGIAEIYRCWTTAAGLEKWFLRQCKIKNSKGDPKSAVESFEAGDTFTWRWHGWPDEVLEEGTILAVDGSSLIRFTFGQQDAEAMTCTVKLYTEEGENICEIMQDNIPVTEKGKCMYHVGCLTGWNFFLVNMKSLLEGGIDLRNKNERLKKMINS